MAAGAALTPVRAATLTWIGGSGNWNTTSLNWSGTTWSNLIPDDAVFASTAGTVTLTENITSGTITATTSGYTLSSSSTFGLTVSRIDISSLGANGQLNLGAKLTGNQALSLAGAGDITPGGSGNANLGIRLTNSANDFVGDVTITNRLVSYTADAVFGNAANKIIMDGGGLLDNNQSINLARNIEVGSGGGIIRFWNTSNATWSGSFSGSGNVSRTDMGTLNLSGDLSGYSGTFTQNGNAGIATNLTGSGIVGGNWTATVGTITFNSASNQTAGGAFSGAFAKSGAGTLTLTSATVGGNWTVNTGGGLVVESNAAQSMGGLVGGTGNFAKLGSGTLTMTARSTISGTITAGAGTLRLNDARSMTGPAVVSSGATLTIENNGNGGYYQPSRLSITTGTVNNASGAGSNGYHGIYTGTIAASGGASSISLPVYMNQAGLATPQALSIDVATGANLSVSGAINNHPDQIATTATLTKTGAGTLTLSGASAITGNITISSGTVVANSTNNVSGPTTSSLGNMTTVGRTITTNTGATLSFGQPDAIGNYSNVTPVTLIADGGTITRIAGANTFNSIGNVELRNGGRLTTTNGNSATVQSFGLNGNVTVSGTSGSFIDTLSGQTSNSGINLGNNTASYSGTTTFTVSSTGDPTADLTVSASLQDKTLGGASTLLKAGAGTMRVTSANTYSGGTVLRAGAIVAANNSALGSGGTVTLNDASTGANNARLLIDATSGDVTVSRPITVANQGTGTATIGSASTGGSNQANFTGAITLAKDVVLDSGSTGDRLGLSGGIGGTGNVTVIGTNRVVLTGAANTYSGSTAINAGANLQLSDGSSVTTDFIPNGSNVTVNGLLSLAKGGNSETINALLGSGTVRAVVGSDTLIVGGSGGSGTFSGGLVNFGGATLAFTKSGAGTQVLTGSSSYTGATTITGGTLQIGNGGATGFVPGNPSVSAGASLAFNRNDALTYGGTVGGAGNLVQVGTGTLTLSAANTYTGTTSLAAGVLALGNANAIGTTGTISFTGGTLQFTASNADDYSSRFSTAAGQAFSLDTNGRSVTLASALTSVGATLAKLGSGTLTLTAASTYSGNTTISGGVLQLGGGGASGSVAGAIVNDGTLVVNRSDAFALSNTISGTGGIVQAGSGTTSLTGVNTYSGATTITAGALAVSQESNLGTAPGSATPGSIVINGGSLAFTTGFTVSANRGIALGPASGAGIGTIDVASGQTLNYAGTIANNGGGTGGLVKAGAGSLIVAGNHTYTGTTSVNAGTLQVTSGSLASTAVVVAGGATLSGAGTVNATTVGDPGILTPGVVTPGVGGIGTLTLASLTFTGSATVNVGVQSNAPSSLLQVNGNVTTAGVNTVTFAFGSNLASIGTGTYTLLAYTGTPLADVSAFGYSGATGARQSVDLVNATQAVNLVIGNSFPIWSGTDGSGWSTTGNWVLNTTGLATSFLANDTVVFNDASSVGSVTLSQNVNPTTTTFSGTTLAYTISSTGGFGITSGNLVKSGPATLTILTSNAFSGGTTLSAGTIRVGNDAALGTGAVTVSGSAAGMTLSSDGGSARTLANGLHLDGDVTLGNATDNGALSITGTVTFDGSTRTITTASDVTLAGLITNGGFTKAGAGVLTVTGSNDYAAGTTLSAGSLRVGNDAALGTGGVTLADGVTLSSDSVTARTLTNAVTLTGNVTLGDAVNTGALSLGSVGGVNLGGATRQVTTPSNVTFAGPVTSGGLTKAGAGTLTLAVANSYAAGTTLSAGDIALGNVAGLGTGTATYAGAGTIRNTVAGTISNAIVVNAGVAAGFDSAANVTTLSGAVANAGTFTLTTTATQTLSGIVSGTGALVKAGSGRAVLSAVSTYTGDTTISAGSLEIGGAGQLGGGSYAGAIANAGTLAVASSANQTLSGVVSGVGSLAKSGAGTLTLSNASNSFSGGSTITGGTVAFESGALGSTGAVTINNAALRWAAGNSQDLSSRLVLVNSATATLDVGTNDVTLADGIGAATSGAVTKTGAGTLTLTGSNGYSGLTTVSGGTLQIGAGGSAGSVGGDIANAGTVTFNRSDAVAYAGLISGAGDVRQVGSGTLTLAGNNTFSGQLTVAQGAVALSTVNNASANGPLGNSTNSVVLGSSGATGLLAYTGATASSTKRFSLATGGTGSISVPAATTLTLSGSIDGSGAFVKQGPGTLSLSGSSPFSGNMTIAGGTVTVNLTVNTNNPNFTSLGNMTSVGRTITVNSGATLNFVAADPIGNYTYRTPVTLIADGGTIFRSSSPGNYFNSLGDVELRNGGRLTTSNGNDATVQSYGLNGNLTVSGTSGSFIDTVGSSFNGINLGNNVSYGGSTTFTVNSTGDATADLTVSVSLANRTLGGASALVKAGAGRMLLTAANTYSGNTTINAGTVAVGTGGRIYSGAFAASVLTVNGGATLDLQNWAYGESSQSLGGLTAAATGVVVNGGTIRISGTTPTSYGRGVTVNSNGATFEAAAGATWTIDTVTDSQAWVYNGNPTVTLAGGGNGTFQKVLGNGSGGLTKSGTGTWTLSGVNTFTGNTTISAGTLVLGGAGQLGGGTYAGAITNDGGFVVSTSANQTLSGVVGGSGSLAKSGSGTLTLSNASNSYSGGSTISAGVLSFANDALGPSGAVTVNGGTLRWESGNTQDVSSRLALVAATAATLDTNGNNVTLGTGFGGGTSGSLVKTGAGTLALIGSNDYSGGTTLSEGTLSFGSGGLGSAGNVALAANTVLAWASGNTEDVSSRLVLPASGTATLDVGSNNVTLASGFGAGSAGSVTKAGAGTLTLTGSSAYTGVTTLNAGTLALSGSGRLAASSAVDLIASGATFDISGADGNRTIGTLNGAAGSAILLGGNTLTAGGDNTTFAGVISGSGGFTKAGGAGILELSSVQEFTGAATVAQGTLLLGSGTSLALASRIDVLQSGTIEAVGGLVVVNNQTLGGYGTVFGGVTFDRGSFLSPGGSVGTLTNDGSSTWNSGLTYVFELNDSGTAAVPGGPSGWDLYNVTNTLTLAAGPEFANQIVIDLTSLAGTGTGSAANFNDTFNYQWRFAIAGSEITTFNPSWFRVNTANFLNLPGNPERFYVAVGGANSFEGEDNQALYVVYAAVPEPGTLALAGIGLVAAATVLRRRRTHRD